jgi:hypothetical protein
LLLAAVIAGVSPAAAIDFDVQGTNVTVGGYLKLQMIYDTDGTVDTGPFDGDLIGGYDPFLDGDPLGRDEGEDFRMTARESRLWVKTKTDTDGAVVKTHFEGDFFGGSDVDSETWSSSTSYRLRHAYGSLTKGSHVVLAGQTWSNFMDLAAGVPEMDLAGDPGFCFVRQPQVRYQHNLRPGHYIAVSIENPNRGLTAAGPVSFFTNAGTSKETLPDFVFKHFYANKKMTLSPRFLLRQFDLTDSTTGQGGTAMAWAAALSGSFKAGPARFTATFMYGDGVGRYGGLGNIGGAGLTATNDVETVGFMSVNGGVTFTLTDTVKWAVGAGWAENDDDGYTGTDAILTANATNTAMGYHTNLKWAVTPSFEWAIGVGYYQREVMDGTEGDMVRYQSYFKYSF